MNGDFEEPIVKQPEESTSQPEEAVVSEDTPVSAQEPQEASDSPDASLTLPTHKGFPLTRAIFHGIHKTLSAIWSVHSIKLTVTLLLITCIAAGLLGFVNSLTEEPIAAYARQTLEDALRLVCPGADTYEPAAEQPTGEGVVTGLYLAKKGGQLQGYCVSAAPAGYGGAVQLMIGVNPLGEVTQVTIMKMSETPGLGSRASDESWLSQFAGKRLGVRLASADEDIHAISGATITSQAVTDGVAAALAFLATLE